MDAYSVVSCDKLLSPVFMLSKFIVLRHVSILQSLYGQITFHHILLFHSSADRHVGYFHLLAIMNNADMNVHLHVCVQAYAFISLGSLHIYLGVEWLVMVTKFANSQTVFESGCTTSHSHHQ